MALGHRKTLMHLLLVLLLLLRLWSLLRLHVE